jgi:hypothetical protein
MSFGIFVSIMASSRNRPDPARPEEKCEARGQKGRHRQKEEAELIHAEEVRAVL